MYTLSHLIPLTRMTAQLLHQTETLNILSPSTVCSSFSQLCFITLLWNCLLGQINPCSHGTDTDYQHSTVTEADFLLIGGRNPSLLATYCGAPKIQNDQGKQTNRLAQDASVCSWNSPLPHRCCCDFSLCMYVCSVLNIGDSPPGYKYCHTAELTTRHLVLICIMQGWFYVWHVWV